MKGAKFEFIASHLEEYGVSGMCRALGVTRQGYHAWASRPPSAHEERDLELAGLIGAEYDASRGIYGAPKVFMVLPSIHFSPNSLPHFTQMRNRTAPNRTTANRSILATLPASPSNPWVRPSVCTTAP